MSATLVSVTPEQLEAICKGGENFELIDVRSPGEFQSLHAEPAKNVPLDQLKGEALAELVRRSSRHTVYVICQKGGRGQTACEKLLAAGAESIANVEGGTSAWAAAGLPVVRGKASMSIERQTRIALGGITLAGAVMALLVHPAWVWLCAAMGAALIYSGVTDFCGMALILAKAPWNQGSTSSTCSTPGA
jgi:rhodanese-related sulfurtransferase